MKCFAGCGHCHGSACSNAGSFVLDEDLDEDGMKLEDEWHWMWRWIKLHKQPLICEMSNVFYNHSRQHEHEIWVGNFQLVLSMWVIEIEIVSKNHFTNSMLLKQGFEIGRGSRHAYNLQQSATICSNFLQEYVQMLVCYLALISVMFIHVFQDDVYKSSMDAWANI